MRDFDNQVAAVAGIGAAMARRFAVAGVKAVIADIDRDAAEKIAASLVALEAGWAAAR